MEDCEPAFDEETVEAVDAVETVEAVEAFEATEAFEAEDGCVWVEFAWLDRAESAASLDERLERNVEEESTSEEYNSSRTDPVDDLVIHLSLRVSPSEVVYMNEAISGSAEV